MPPTLANGKICYVEMPTMDIARSAEFYKRIFGWNIRKRGDGSTSFDDTVGEVSGTWVLGGRAFYFTSLSTAWQRPSTRSPLTEASASSRSAATHRRSPPGSAIPQAT